MAKREEIAQKGDHLFISFSNSLYIFLEKKRKSFKYFLIVIGLSGAKFVLYAYPEFFIQKSGKNKQRLKDPA